MGIAGFFVWLQRWYNDAIDFAARSPDERVANELLAERSKQKNDDQVEEEDMPPAPVAEIPEYDNLYLDMNALIHPCCHDTAPLPEPETEEEMFLRIFKVVEEIFDVVVPKRVLFLAIDGVAPRSKMNQQRSRRFRSALEREESNDMNKRAAQRIAEQHGLPMPKFRDRWDHNVITPSTAFMERAAQTIEWFIIQKQNTDERWRRIAIIFSDAHVPGEGEHKIMQFIRGLRSQRGYNPHTSHCIFGMDADLICLALATHEANFAILRNKINETYQPIPNTYCFFNITKFRRLLKRDFMHIENMDFERIVDDFVFLCFFVGNDFLPHVPLISIKTKGIEAMLDHYVRNFPDHKYLTKNGDIKFDRLGAFLKSFCELQEQYLLRAHEAGLKAKARAISFVQERCEESAKAITEVLDRVAGMDMDPEAASNELLKHYTAIDKETSRYVFGKQPLGFKYGEAGFREKYYGAKFGWRTEAEVEGEQANKSTPVLSFAEREEKISKCCREYFRGMQWVLWYYTKGCPSWEWFFPYHYAPLLGDLSANWDCVDIEMAPGEPLPPVVQLVAVLPRESAHALPTELQEAVMDPSSVLGKFYPTSFTTDFSEASFSYQGVVLLPFINCNSLRKVCGKLMKINDEGGTAQLFCHKDHPLRKLLDRLLFVQDTFGLVPVNDELVRCTPISGRVGEYPRPFLLGARLECPDKGLRMKTLGTANAHYSDPVPYNAVACYSYEVSTHTDYIQKLLVHSKPKKNKGAALKRSRDRDKEEPQRAPPAPLEEEPKKHRPETKHTHTREEHRATAAPLVQIVKLAPMQHAVQPIQPQQSAQQQCHQSPRSDGHRHTSVGAEKYGTASSSLLEKHAKACKASANSSSAKVAAGKGDTTAITKKKMKVKQHKAAQNQTA